MTIRIGINGLGRIGRCVLRAIYEEKYPELEVVAINGSRDVSLHAHLLQYDSIHGRFMHKIEYDNNHIMINNKKIPLYREKQPENIPWTQDKVDIVLECTGAFNNKALASKHLGGTVKKVLISAPASDADATVVYGVNDHVIKPEYNVISAGSCTTNCLAPILQVINERLGIANGFMTTVHAYTNDQNIVDGTHKDLRRARAAALSMIPTSTGAAKIIGLIIPSLQGKIAGTALRVPTANVSFMDLTITTNTDTSVNEINSIFSSAAANSKVLSVCEEPLVSIDFNHTPHSAIVDLTATHVVDDRLCRIAAWYDNEWAFSLRMLDIAIDLFKFM